MYAIGTPQVGDRYETGTGLGEARALSITKAYESGEGLGEAGCATRWHIAEGRRKRAECGGRRSKANG